MDTIVNQIQALSTNNDSDLKRLKDFLRNEQETLKAHAACIGQALASLDRTQHTLGISCLLAVQLSNLTPTDDRQQVFSYVSGFLRCADEQQVKKGSVQFMTTCKCYAQLAVDLGSPAMLQSLVPLRCAYQVLRPNAETWTPVHTEFLRICLRCKAYHLGAAVLDDPVYDLPSGSGANSQHVTPQSFLNYFYYGALLRIGLKDYLKALQLLLVVLTWPASCLSDTQAEAYKKYVLVSLRLHGEVKALPVYTSSVVMKLVQEAGYEKKIAKAFEHGTPSALTGIAESHAAAIGEDDNTGLVSEVIESLNRHKLQTLTKTYVTLSLSEIAKEVGAEASVAQIEALLFDMISAGEINARIEQTTGNVFFEEEPDDADAVMVGNMQGKLQQILGLAQRIAAFEQEVVSGEAYIKKTTIQGSLGAVVGSTPQGDFDFMDM